MKHSNTQSTNAHAFSEHSTSTRNERFYAAFTTHNPRVPFVEVTVVCRSRKQAKAIARELVAPLGLTIMELD